MTLPNSHALLEEFQRLSDYKVNTSKMEVLPININSSLFVTLKTNFSYRVQSTSVKYLGTFITPHYDYLYHANFPPLFGEIQGLLSRWHALPISLFESIRADQMTYC